MIASASFYHRPALLEEAIALLGVGPGAHSIDATLGDGGHALALLNATAPDGQLLGLDADPLAIERANQRLQLYSSRLTLVESNFNNLENVVASHNFSPVLAILMDLGLSSWQLQSSGRGFSFRENAPLDMRLSPEQPITASNVVNTFTADELTNVIATYGEEPRAKRIATQIIRDRPIKTAFQLAQSIEAVIPRHGRRLHPATRTFQAIRMLVNCDLQSLELALQQALRVMARGGRLVVIAYHSLEDRLVKMFMKREAKDCICHPYQTCCTCDHRASISILTRKVVKPTREESLSNPRVRSARLRACSVLEQSLGQRMSS